MASTIPQALLPRPELRAALAIAGKVVERRTHKPILTNVLLRDGADGFEVVATNLDMAVTARIPSAIADSDFSIALPHHALATLEKRAAATDDVTAEITDPGSPPVSEDRERGTEARPAKPGATTLRFGSVSCSMQATSAAEWPEMRIEGDIKADFEVATADLLAALTATEFAISTEETRYYLNGVYMHHLPPHYEGAGARLAFVSTDGHQMAVHEMSAPTGTAKMPGVIIPRKTIAFLRSLCKAKKAPATVRIVVNTVKAMFTLGSVTVLTKLVDGTFPDYVRAMPPSSSVFRVTVDRNALAEAVRAVSSVSSERGRTVKLAIADERITASCDNLDLGSVSAAVPCDLISDSRHGPYIDIGFNARHLLDILANVDAGTFGTVILGVNDPGSPVLIRGSSGVATQYVLMPMRV